MLIVHNQPTQPLWITVVIPPKESNNPVKAFVDVIEALAYAKKCPEGTRYTSMRVEGDVLAAITPTPDPEKLAGQYWTSSDS
jgi:hypothetical protein